MTEIEKVEACIAGLVAVNKTIQDRHRYTMKSETRKIVFENSSKITAGQKWLAEQRVEQIVNKM